MNSKSGKYTDFNNQSYICLFVLNAPTGKYEVCYFLTSERTAEIYWAPRTWAVR